MPSSTHSPVSATTALPVMEHFYTIQGEGYHQGKAAYFVRLAGCDVGCTWCDVKDSWDESNSKLIAIPDLISIIQQTNTEIVVITGGEPLMHNLDELTKQLHLHGFSTNIETSGSHPLSGTWDWICLSPKKFKKPLPNIVALANELKIIVFNKSDFDWAEKYAAKTNNACKLYLQPEWSKAAEITPLIVDYIKQHPKWILSLQIHKHINVP
jgi:organic radical activating enzyme